MSNKRKRAIRKEIDRRTKDKIRRIRAAKKIEKERDAKPTPVKDAALAFTAGAGTAAALGKISEKNKAKQKNKKINKRGGGMTRQGLYPAEEARSGTMSEAKRKRYMKSGGIVKRAGGGKAYNKKVMSAMNAKTVDACYTGFK